MFIKQFPEGQIPMLQRTAMVGKWQVHTQVIMQFYNNKGIKYLIIR